MKRKITVLLILFLLVSLTITPIVLSGSDNGSNDGDYYFGYGDSVTAGKKIDGAGNYDFTASYITRLCTLFDTGRTSDHIGDEGGGNTGSYDIGYAWDSGDVRYYYDWLDHTNNEYFIYNLGINDVAWYHGWTPTSGPSHPPEPENGPSYLVTGMLKIWNETIENGTKPVLCIPNGCDCDQVDRYPGFYFVNYSAFYNWTMRAYRNYSIPFVPLWDSMDQSPWDGVMQPVDESLMGLSVHPNRDGHDEMAYMLWYFLNNWDYNTTYYSGNNTLFLDADYNETIYLNNSHYNWDTDTLTVHCETNSTDINFTVQTAFNGSEMIRFDIMKDNMYSLADERNDIAFQSINNQENNTIVYVGSRTFNWTKVDGAVYYHLQVANDSAFTDVFINLSDVNETNYGVRYDEIGDSVEFMLPVANEISWIGSHYYRVRAYKLV